MAVSNGDNANKKPMKKDGPFGWLDAQVFEPARPVRRVVQPAAGRDVGIQPGLNWNAEFIRAVAPAPRPVRVDNNIRGARGGVRVADDIAVREAQQEHDLVLHDAELLEHQRAALPDGF
jgi:hypothetical protein